MNLISSKMTFQNTSKNDKKPGTLTWTEVLMINLLRAVDELPTDSEGTNFLGDQGIEILTKCIDNILK